MRQKPTKQLISDCLPQDQPQGSIRHGKNGVQNHTIGAVINEPGFLRSSAQIPYIFNGVIETDTKPIIFSTDNTNSAIGFYDTERDSYVPILDDKNLPFKIGFKRENYITGEYQKNNKGEYVVAFTDKSLPMMSLNCSSPGVINKFDDLLFFVSTKAPEIIVKVGNSGQIDGGSYRVAVKLLKEDGTESSYLGLSGFVFAAASSSGDTANKSLDIEIKGLDRTFNRAVVAILKQSKGVFTAIELEPISVGDDVRVTYTGNESYTNITPEELLIPAKSYTKVGTIGQLNDSLYIGNLTEEEEVQYQQYANMIKVQFESKLYNLSNPDHAAQINAGEVRGFQHEEVIALYIRMRKTSGGWSRAFHVPGAAPEESDRVVISTAGAKGKTFQLLDTIKNFNAALGIGTPGVWENEDEFYPIQATGLDQFDSRSLGGLKLSGKRVRHHKMPSLSFIRDRLTSRADKTLISKYGKDVLDVIGLKFSNVIIPEHLKDKLTGQYEVLFAKRTQNNVTVYGQSLIVYNQIKANKQGAYLAERTSEGSSVANTRGRNLITVGGNWQSKAGSWDPDPATRIVRESFRLYPFETLDSKPDFPDGKMYLSVNWKTKSVGKVTYPDYLPNGGNPTTPIVVLNFDLTETALANSTTIKDIPFKIIGVGNLTYLKNNTNYNAINGVNNKGGESAVLATVHRSAMTSDPIEAFENVINLGDHSRPTTVIVPREDNYFVTLKALKETLYKNFNSQIIVTTGVTQRIGSEDFVAKGDSFIALHSVMSYGSWSYEAGRNNLNPWIGEAREGYKVSRSYIVESAANLGSRFEITGNAYSFWYLQQGDLGFATNLERTQDPNQVGYNKELNSLAEVQTRVFYDNTPTVNVFPHRIHRGGELPREGAERNWRKFLPLDYYDMPKNLGAIINLQGMDDKLLIHMENSLLVTQDKTKLTSSDVLDVTLGTADIFQFTPQEALKAKLGAAGTRNDLACVMTPMGYIFLDEATGQVYLYKNGLSLLNGGINRFLKVYAKVPYRNTFIGNGVTIGYDPDFNRVLLTVKHIVPTLAGDEHIVDNYEESKEFFDTLVPGKSVIFKDGRWQRFMGISR